MASVVPVREHSEPKFAPRVLVVEDDPMIAWDVSESLQQAGFEVCGIATTGAAALEIADTMHPAAVVMDVNLKGGADGIQTAQRLRAGN